MRKKSFWKFYVFRSKKRPFFHPLSESEAKSEFSYAEMMSEENLFKDRKRFHIRPWCAAANICRDVFGFSGRFVEINSSEGKQQKEEEEEGDEKFSFDPTDILIVLRPNDDVNSTTDKTCYGYNSHHHHHLVLFFFVFSSSMP